MKESIDRISGQLCTVEGCRWKSFERLRERFGGDAAGFRRRAAPEFFGQEGGAGNRRSAAAAKKARFRDTAVNNARRKLEDVATDRIAYLHRCSGAGQFSGIARIAKVIEKRFAEHFREYRKNGAGTATHRKSRKLNAETQSSQRAEGTQEHARGKRIYFFGGKYFFSMEATTT